MLITPRLLDVSTTPPTRWLMRFTPCGAACSARKIACWSAGASTSLALARLAAMLTPSSTPASSKRISAWNASSRAASLSLSAAG
ncbi:hypothetical protein D3C86_1814710 [compost metagenome]